MQNGNIESTQKRMSNLSADLSFMPDNELVELVWQDGQILMQGHSNKTRKIPPISCFSPHTSKPQEKDGGSIVNPKNGISWTSDSGLSDFPHLVPSAHSGLGQNDDTVLWLNYPLDDTMQHDNCSEFFSELPGVNLDENDTVPVYRDINSGHIVRNSRAVLGHSGVNPEPGNLSKVAGGVPQPTRPRNSQIHPSSLHQSQNLAPSLRSRISDFYGSNTNNTNQADCSISSQIPNPTIGSPNMQMPKQDQQLKRPPPQLNSRTGLMNFSHFARPAALIKSNLHGITTPDLSSIDKLTSNDKVSTANSSNHVESLLIESTSGYKSVTAFQSQLVSVSNMADARSSVAKPPREPLLTEQSEAICQEDVSTSNRLPDQVLVYSSSFVASTSIGSQDSEKGFEPAVASSSLCSDSSAGGTSSNPKHNLKRTSRDTEDSECQSEDVEAESVGGRKPASARGGTGSKRSRAAEVHNLSERRRRDRINEKMRALQELIPNCNKVDKASMLDEAIEYLKTLQLQVQIMSMATGLYMPPMVSPTGVQHIHAPHLSHFFPMGVGMSMGFGLGVNLGMGMLDISGGSSACTSIQVPPIHGAQFSGPSISGTTSFPPMVGSSMQMFGLPGQGLSMSIPCAPFIPLSEGPSMKPLTVADVSGTAAHEQPGSASVPTSSTKLATQCVISTMMHQTNAHCLQNHTSSQSEATKEGYKQITLAQRADQIAHVNDSGGVNSTTKGNEST